MERFVRRAETPAEEIARHLRVVASPGADMFLDELAGFPEPPDWAAPLRPTFQPWAHGGHRLRVLLLCAGIDGPGHALAGLGVSFEAEIWDVDPSLQPGLLKLHRSKKDLHLGPVAGDILRAHESSFGAANVLIAGPPCPPWSGLGSGESFDDPRAQVFFKVIDIIVHQASRHRSSEARTGLWMILLENVEGMLKTKKADRDAGNPCPLERVKALLQSRLPEHWEFTVIRMETSQAGLPQKRGRVYLRGVDLRAVRMQRHAIHASLAPARIPHPGLSSMLRKDLPNTDKMRAGQGNKYMANLALYKINHAQEMQDTAHENMVAVVDLTRDATRAFGEVGRFDDRCPCLTASNHAL